MEIERKFTIIRLPENMRDYPYQHIEQGYLSTEPVVRIRRQDDTYLLTYKGSGMMVRTEYNLPLTKDAYEHMKPKADGIVITKKRYLIPYESYTIELDVFENELEGLIIAEVEFATEEEATAFCPPPWFKEDVTFDQCYHNNYLSQHGYQKLGE